MPRRTADVRQLSLFDQPPVLPVLPDGFRYRADFLTAEQERALVAQFRDLPFREFAFQGFFGRRRIVSFGWSYDFNRKELQKAADIPAFLTPAREAAARFAGLAPADLQQVLVTEYTPGAAIGWHRDKAVFGDVVGISLLSPCTFRFRRKAGTGWERAAFTAAPRSAYLLRGPAREEWEHSIPAVQRLRYSITFRTFKAG
jgi:alkylated DNA repair dioxygenase AlkB